MRAEITHSEREEQYDVASAVARLGTPIESEYEISLLQILVILLEKKRLIVWITGACTAIAVIISFLLPKWYTATVTLLPPQQNSSMAAALSSQLSSLGGAAALAGGSLGLKNPNDLYVGMLKSRTVEDAMVQHFSLMQEYNDRYPSDARKDFEKHASVDGAGKDGLIHLSVEARNPQRAAQLANGYVDQFQELSKNLAFTEASQRRSFFERQLQGTKDNLANAEEALKQTEQTTGLIQLDSQSRALIESAASIRAQIAAKEVQIEGMQTYATGENAELVQAQRELQGMKAQLAKLGGSEGGGSELIVPRGRVPEAGLEYVRKLRDVKYYETIFDILARQFELAKLDEAKEGALVQVVDLAVPPDRKSYPKRVLIVASAACLGFFLAVVFALAQAAIEFVKRDPESRKRFAPLKRALHWKNATPGTLTS